MVHAAINGGSILKSPAESFVLDSFITSSTPKTYHTKNAVVSFSGYDELYVLVDGTITELENGHSTLMKATYDSTTETLSVFNTNNASYPAKVFYEPI